MTGCRHGAKNSLDKNYLYLAERLGAEVRAETEVEDVRPAGLPDGSEGYFVTARRRDRHAILLRARGVIFSGGVLGTVPLLLKLRDTGSLRNLSSRVGHDVRTNNESMTTVTAIGKNPRFNDGVTIGSIFHPDGHSHVEPIRLGANSGLWRLLLMPLASGRSLLARMASLVGNVATSPLKNMRAWGTPDFAGRTICLLFMQHLDSSVTLARGRGGRLISKIMPRQVAPSADIPLANELTKRTERLLGGKRCAWAVKS